MIGTPARFRPLTQDADLALIRAFLDRSADYVELESGGQPTDANAAEYFTDGPPDCDLAQSLKIGLFAADGALLAITDMAFGYPQPADAFIGLLLIDPAFRGQGLGRVFFDHLKAQAKERDAGRLLVAVLDENTRARAFWSRLGFELEQSFPDRKLGSKIHTLHRMVRPISGPGSN